MQCSKGLWLLGFISVLAIVAVTVQVMTARVHVSPRLAEELFRNFTKKFNKSYQTPDEYQKRLNIFTLSLEDIVNKNLKKNATVKYGITRFSDMTPDEFLGPRWKLKNHTHVVHEQMSSQKNKITKTPSQSLPVQIVLSPNGTIGEQHIVGDDSEHFEFLNPELLAKNLNYIPMKLDWREEDVLLPVRKQGKCGACWAYSVIATIEANLAIRTGNKTRLSVQEMIDCARNGNNGCKGGDTCMLLEWLTESHIPILTEPQYPMSNDVQNITCKLPGAVFDEKQTIKSARIDDFICRSFVGDESELLKIIANYGPVTAAVNAESWQNYMGGVIQTECENDIEKTNHAVEIIGYDRGGAVPHYIVQNSWGEDFGEKGYIRLAMGSNACGIANQISFGRLLMKY